MRRLWILCALTLVFGCPGLWAGDPAAAETPEVRRSFDAYKQALIAGDGSKASRLTASDTHAFLAEIVDRARTMPEQQLRALPLLDQVSVLLLRHNMAPEEIRAMARSDAVTYAVNQRAFDMKEVAKLEAEPFMVNGGQAQAEVSNLKGSPIPVSVHFKDEAGVWRFDLMSSIAPFRAFFESQAGLFKNLKMGDGNSGVVPLIIHLLTGRAPAANIWNPTG